MQWNEGCVRPMSLGELGQRYRRYRLADPEAEEAMAGSLRRWGQLAPVVACVRNEKLELLDGFKPKALLDELADLHREALDPSLRQESIGPRPTSDYQHLLQPEEGDETEEVRQDDDEPA